MQITKKRKLKSSLFSLNNDSSSNEDISKNYVDFDTLSSRHHCYAIIRSKGGSGEMHSTKKLIEDLEAQNRNVLVCYQNDIDENHYFTKYFPPSCSKFFSSLKYLSIGRGGLLNLDWTKPQNLNQLICELNKSPNDYSIIFTCGTSSGGKFIERIGPISSVCKKIFISVNSAVAASIEPAKQLCDNLEICTKNISISWWYSPSVGVHQLTIFDLYELSQYSTQYFNEKSLVLNDISMLD
jgi:hypothetical protein